MSLSVIGLLPLLGFMIGRGEAVKGGRKEETKEGNRWGQVKGRRGSNWVEERKVMKKGEKRKRNKEKVDEGKRKKRKQSKVVTGKVGKWRKGKNIDGNKGRKRVEER